MKKLFVFAFWLFTISCSASDSTLVNKRLAPQDHQKQVSIICAQVLRGSHYDKPAYDDNLADRIFKEYLKNIDYAHAFFLQTDIDRFEKDRSSLDNYASEGKLDFAFDVYNTFLERAEKRIRFIKASLKDSFSYDAIDSFEIDREEANWFLNEAEADKYWTKRIKFECLSYQVSGTNWKSASDNIRKRYENYEKQLLKMKSQDVFDIWMNSVTEVIDPHTNYMSPRRSDDFNISMSLSLEGIGATLQTDNDYTVIRDLVKGGPAEKSKKLKIGDRIIGVAQGEDGEIVDVVGWRIDDVIQLIRGKRGTIVKLNILASDENNPAKAHKVVLERDKIKLEEQAAKGEIREVKRGKQTVKVGIVKLPTFYLDFAGMQRGDKDYKSTSLDVKKILEDFKAKKVQAVLVDLRNNGGGSLLEAIQMTGLFIDKGPVVQVRNTDGSVNVEEDKESGASWDGPMAVLVNRFSASASEIFAAAIQDYSRGIILGENTYGKGTVQNLLNLDQFVQGGQGGQLKLTIAKFYRVNGSSTQLRGVKPDIEYPGFFSAKEYGEEASPYALRWDQIKGATDFKPLNRVGVQIPKLTAEHTARLKDNVAYENLMEEIAESNHNRERKFATLNKELLKMENDGAAARKKERQKRLGITEESDKAKKNADTPAPLYDKNDWYLNESEQILVDLLAK